VDVAGPVRAFRVGLALAVAACSGNHAKLVEDARGTAALRGDAPARDAAVPGDAAGKGDVQVRVEWRDVPAGARASPGRTPCGTPRPAAVSPTTLWGIPDVFVAIDAGAGARTAAPQRIVLADCLLSPRAAVVAGSFTVASRMDMPVELSLVRAGELPLGGDLKDGQAREIYLPITGHEVEVPVSAGAIYRLVAGDETAWIVAADGAYVAVTEASGQAVLHGVPEGPHAVTAWLPPRSGQPARIGRGTVNVAPGARTEVTVDITKQ
jgi:hypothetical protein